MGFAAIGMIALFVWNVPILKQRTTDMVQQIIHRGENSEGSNDARWEIWNSAIAVIKAQPLLGTGTGDVEDELFNQFKKDNFKSGIMNGYDSHNQFIQTTVALGILGLLALIIFYGVPLYKSLVEKQYMFSVVLAFFILSSLTESLLETQCSVIFFALFSTLMSLQMVKKTFNSAQSEFALS